MINGTYFISLMLVIPVISAISYFFRHFKETSIGMSLVTLLFTTIVFTFNSGTDSDFYLNNINRYILI